MQRAVLDETGCIASLHVCDEHALAELEYMRGSHRRTRGSCSCGVEDVEDDARVGDQVEKKENA